MVIIVPVAVLVVVVLGVVYVLFLRRAVRDGGVWKAVAVTGLVAGLVAALSTALAAVMTFTPLLEKTPFNGPLGLVAFLGIPIALVGVGCGALGLKSASRGLAISGLALSVVSLVAWVVMQLTMGG